MIERKWLGDKTKGGFYKKVKSPGKEDERMALDWKTLEYHPRQKPKFAALDMAKKVEDTGAAGPHAARPRWLRAQKPDKAAISCGLRSPNCGPIRRTASRKFPTPVVEIDRAMRMGFNWELGPFELWDAAGVAATVERMKKEGRPVAANVEKLLASGQSPGTQTTRRLLQAEAYFDLATGASKPVAVPAGVWSVAVAKKSNGVVKKNSGASLVDLGDGVGCIEFHSKMNALGADIISLILQTLKPGGPGDAFDAFVITNDAHELLRRRQSDAPAHVRAGRRMG